jgi:phenylpyruvate tautomerase PptA (4-oxalocrotonate tautomerase family)
MMEQVLPLLPQTESEVKTVVEQWDADLAHNASDRLPSVDKPPLVIGGEQDLVAPPWQCRKVAELIPGPRRRSSPGRAPAMRWAWNAPRSSSPRSWPSSPPSPLPPPVADRQPLAESCSTQRLHAPHRSSDPEGKAMPLLYFDVIEGRTPGEIKALLDTAQAAAVEAFGVPERDRYQVVRSHPAGEIVALDTGLGINRSDQLVIIHVVSRRRTRAQKERLYALLAERLRRDCGLDPADLIVSVTENDDEDWSFGSGRAQFLTGELHC